MNPAGKKLIIFSGLKHSGKSSLARLFSQRLGLPAQDLDVLIARRVLAEHPEFQGTGDHAAVVRAFYRACGRDAFMACEARAAGEAATSEVPASGGAGGGAAILSLGGGTMENEAAMAKLAGAGLVIFLDAPCELLFERIMRGGLPAFLDPADPRKSFENLYERRRRLGIERAHHVVELGAKNLEQAYSELVPFIKEHINVR
jgi:shikimate kinase